MAYIYALIAPPNYPEPRYVGVTIRPLRERLRGHLSRAKTGERTPKATWIRKCDRLGIAVQIVLLEEVAEDEWASAEIRWIAHFSGLTNSTAGGQGILRPTPEHRLKLRESHLGQRQSEETRAKRAQSMMGNKNSLGVRPTTEIRAKLSAAQMGNTNGRGKRWTEEQRAAHSVRLKGKTGKFIRTDDYRRKQSAAHAGRSWGCHSEEHRQHMSQIMTGRTPSAETRAKMSAAAKARHQKKAAGVGQ